MKKGYVSVVVALTLVLGLSLLCTFFFPVGDSKSFKKTSCLTDSITENMSRQEIATLYKSGTVAVYVESTYRSGFQTITQSSLGSGVCVASIGYQAGEYSVSQGSYFVTNYHVINVAVEEDFSNYDTSVSIVLDDGNYTAYSAEVLWASQELDMALLFCDEQIDGLQWIEMKDRSINPAEGDELGFDEVFTLGTPLNLQYINTLSLGYVSNTSAKESASTKDFYYWTDSDGSITGTSNASNAVGSFMGTQPTEVLENMYEDLIMINLDITHGNSGGGLFDSEGYLIGLTTLGLTYEDTNGAQMNFAVPIYPLTQILDKIILQNEQGGSAVISYQTLGLNVADVNMTSMAKSIQEQMGVSFYYLDGMIVEESQSSLLDFEEEGVVVLANSGTGLIANLTAGSVITGADFGNASERVDINDRNDLIFFLLQCDSGDMIHVYYRANGSERESSMYVQL